jgi:GNAT superfamily N-acetyltransferase
MTLTITTATPADAPALVKLSGQLGYPSAPGQLEARLADLLGRPDEHRIWVARSGAAVAGWLHAFVARYLVDDPFVEIGGLVVAEEERGHGIGPRLVDEACAWARALGCDRVGVHSNVVREDAHRFYERIGFVLEKRQGVFTLRVPR